MDFNQRNYLSVCTFYFIGMKHLTKLFITSTVRETIFCVANISIICVTIGFNVLSILTRNEPYSPYQLIQNNFHWSASSTGLVGFILVELTLHIELVLNFLFNAVSLYTAFFSLNFWLRKIWLARHYLSTIM